MFQISVAKTVKMNCSNVNHCFNAAHRYKLSLQSQGSKAFGPVLYQQVKPAQGWFLVDGSLAVGIHAEDFLGNTLMIFIQIQKVNR